MFSKFSFKPLYCEAAPSKVVEVEAEEVEPVDKTEVAEPVAAPETPQEDPEIAERRSLVLNTAGFDARFPNTNQIRNCWQNYVDYFRCIESKGEDFEPCQQFQKVYKSLCPIGWVDSWDEQREGNVFPGLAPGRWKNDSSKHH